MQRNRPNSTTARNVCRFQLFLAMISRGRGVFLLAAQLWQANLLSASVSSPFHPRLPPCFVQPEICNLKGPSTRSSSHSVCLKPPLSRTHRLQPDAKWARFFSGARGLSSVFSDQGQQHQIPAASLLYDDVSKHPSFSHSPEILYKRFYIGKTSHFLYRLVV